MMNQIRDSETNEECKYCKEILDDCEPSECSEELMERGVQG